MLITAVLLAPMPVVAQNGKSSCQTVSRELGISTTASHQVHHDLQRVCGQGALDSPSAWCTDATKPGEWYQMDLGVIRTVRGVVTQGRRDKPQWVKTYKVQASQDGVTWYAVGKSFKVAGKVQTVGNTFIANKDSNTKITKTFQQPVTARYVRIRPQTWQGKMSLRAGLVVCTGSIAAAGCMEKNVNHEAHGKVSSQYNHDHCRQGALDSPAGWCSNELKAGVWYQMDAGTVTNISGVVTQGRHDACVYAYLPSLLTMADVCVTGPVRIYLLVPSSS